MDYTVPTHKETLGDVIPLFYVAEAMARKAASGFGMHSVNSPTLKNTRQQYSNLLLSEAKENRLKVCDQIGRLMSAVDLIADARGLPNPACNDSDIALAILALNVLPIHLADWGKNRGDVFHVVDVLASTTPDGSGWWADPFAIFGSRGYVDVPELLSSDEFVVILGNRPDDPAVSNILPEKKATNGQTIPGTIPRTSIGQIAIQVAWKIECKQGRRATCKEVMSELCALAKSGDVDFLQRGDEAKKVVYWVTKKFKSKDFSIEACQKVLGRWLDSRQ